jgi:MFS family permease
VKHGLRALRHRNFRLFLTGQFISLIGTWMQSVALGWLVYRLSHSPFLLGLAGFLGQIPSLFFSPLVGVWADRWNRHRMVIATQALAMLQALALAALVLSGRATVAEVLGLTFLLGFVNAMDVPSRQSFVFEMVQGAEDLPSAIALNSSVFNVARLIGPSVAGVLIGAVGEGIVFLVNGVSYVAVIAALLAIRLPRRERRSEEPAPVWSHLVEGVHYAAGFSPIRSVLLLIALVSLVGAPYTVLMPIFATDVLHGGAHTLGFLVGSIGVGALAGAAFLASRRSVRGLGNVIVRAVAAFALGLMALALVQRLWMAVAVLTVTGFGLMVHIASSNTILQTLVDHDKRGRVMSLFTVAFMGTTPIGSLLAGALAGRVGARWTVASGGVICLAGAGLLARALPRLREQARPVYARLGIIPEVAGGARAGEAPAAADAGRDGLPPGS